MEEKLGILHGGDFIQPPENKLMVAGVYLVHDNEMNTGKLLISKEVLVSQFSFLPFKISFMLLYETTKQTVED